MPENTMLRQVVEQEIASTKSRIEALQQKLYDLAEKLNTTSSIMSTLPQDVLAEIFFFAIQHADFKSVPVPFLLGGICRAWRSFVWSTPRLWSFLFVMFTPTGEQSQQALLEEWFRRSANHPLHVNLKAVSPREYWFASEASYQVLLKSCAQWKTFTIEGDGLFQDLRHQTWDNRAFPLLSHLALPMNPFTRVAWNFSTAPQLRVLELSGRGCSDEIRYDRAVVHHLKATFDVNEWLSILQHSSSLRTCKVVLAKHPISPATHFDDRGGPHTLPALTKLAIQYIGADNSDEIVFLLCNILVPSLQRLEITTDIPDWFTHLKETLLHSQCSLTELTIHIVASHDSSFEDGLVELLPDLAFLTRLTLISKVALSDRLINALNPDLIPDTEGCLPNLTAFSCTGEISFNLHPVLSTLRAREKYSAQGSAIAPSPPIKPLDSFAIRYRNAAWAQTKDPNALQAFYLEMASFGTKTSIVWDESA